MTQSPPHLEYAQRALRLIPRLNRWAVASVQAHPLGRSLSLRQLSVLHAIGEGVSSPGQLALRLRVTPAVVTGLVDRLERQGHVRREPEPNDRRRFRLVLTETGLAVRQEIQHSLSSQLAARLADASAPDLEAMDRALKLLEHALVALEAAAASAPLGAADD